MKLTDAQRLKIAMELFSEQQLKQYEAACEFVEQGEHIQTAVFLAEADN